jgi:multidrug resistance efflux pump
MQWIRCLARFRILSHHRLPTNLIRRIRTPVATKMVNASLVGLLSDLDTLETDLASAEAQLAASAAELQTLQETADEALSDAQAARTAAEAALAAWGGS